MNPRKYSIRDLERITGIRAHTIRMWEKRYGIVQPERTDTNIRYYSDKHLQKLMNICVLNKNGRKISHISVLSDNEIINEVAQISDTAEGLDVDINTMVMAAIDLHEEQFENTLNSSILKIGFERTFSELVFPLFIKMSIFWQIGRINICQEQFIINLVRQKLLVAIDGLVGQANSSPRKFLLFLPAGEYNEIGLLFANYLIRKSGDKVVYLGASVPLEHIRGLTGHSKFKEILINITLPKVEDDLRAYLTLLRDIFPFQNIHLVLSRDATHFDQNTFPNIQIYNTFAHFSSVINKL